MEEFDYRDDLYLEKKTLLILAVVVRPNVFIAA